MARSNKTKDFGWGWRTNAAGAIEKQVKVKVEFYSLPLEQFISKVREAAEGLSEVKVEMDKVYVKGWREATGTEIRAKKAEIRERQAASAAYLDRAERELRALRPELFKD